jgi:hypothetical protein
MTDEDTKPVVTAYNNAEDNLGPRWDLSQERAFIETLVGQRFNYMLIFFSIICAGFINAKDEGALQAVLPTIGAIVCACLALAIGRAQQKLDIILGLLHRDPRHPVSVTATHASGKSRRGLIGYTIPWMCTAILAVAATVSWIGTFMRS